MSTGDDTAPASSTAINLLPLDTAIAILTANYVVISWNSRAESMTGYTLERVNQRELIHLFEPAEVMQQVLLKGQAGEFPVDNRLELRTADGRCLPVDVQCVPLQSLKGSEAQLVIVVRQVAPLQDWQRQKAQRQILGRLAGSLSHEIRNPLNAIFLHTDIVEEEVRQPISGDRTQVLRSLSTIKAEGMRLQALIQDYLFLARLSDLHRVPEDLRALIEALILEMQVDHATRGVTLLLSAADDLGEVVVHKNLFRCALFNIMQRLIEAIPENGTLTLAGQRTTSHLHLGIHDTGKTIPTDAWAALRTALQTMNPEAGLDFGVYVAREIIAAHGGEVAVTDVPGTGMVCTVTLALDTQYEGSSQSSAVTLHDPS
jgi:two-component system, NtrC family, sensor histidine kinase AtoS